MRKIFFATLLSLIVLSFSFIPLAKAETATVVATCWPDPNLEGYRTVFDIYSESFVPTVNTLTKIEVSLQTVDASGASARFGIGVSSNSEVGALETTTINLTSGIQTYSYTFPSPLTVSTSTTYYIFVKMVTVTAPFTLNWGTTSNSSCYAGGAAIQDPYYMDYMFKLWGYNVAGSTPVAGSTTTTSTGSTVGSTPTTSSSMAKPTGLTAAYVTDPKVGIKLTWTKSTTTDITGYNIYRSETTGTGYTKIGTTTKDVAEYLDESIVGGKTYYYTARAYKGTTQSVASTEATATTPAIVPTAVATATTTAPVTNADVLVDDSKFTATPVVWSLSAIALVLIGGLAFMIVRRRILAKKAGGEVKPPEVKPPTANPSV